MYTVVIMPLHRLCIFDLATSYGQRTIRYRPAFGFSRAANLAKKSLKCLSLASDIIINYTTVSKLYLTFSSLMRGLLPLSPAV